MQLVQAVVVLTVMLTVTSYVDAFPIEQTENALLELVRGAIESIQANFANLNRRPIYNVAHMVNSDSQVNLDWVNHANAIEADLEFNADGNPKRFFHGFPCDCGRICSYSSDPITHFATLRRKAQDETQNFVLFWMDLKLSTSGITDFFSSGEKLAEVITRSGSLFPHGEEVPINILLGAVKLDQKEFFRGFRQYVLNNRPELLPKFGYDFSDTSYDVDEILNAFEEVGIRENIWIGDGDANCLRIFRPDTRLKKIIAKRDSYDGSSLAPFKVYAWTVDKTSTMRDLLHLGVDAIIVNYPDRLQSLVKNEFHDSLFLATRETDPWKRILASEAYPPWYSPAAAHIAGSIPIQMTGAGHQPSAALTVNVRETFAVPETDHTDRT